MYAADFPRAVLMGILVATPAIAAAQFRVHSQVNVTKIDVDERMQLIITLSGPSIPRDVPFPMLANLRVAGGPFVSKRLSVIEGTMLQSCRYIYVLAPRAVGAAEVGEVRITMGAISHVAAPIAIEVVATREPPLEAILRRRRGRAQEPKLFVEMALGRHRAYVGEAVLLTYSLYTQQPASDVRWTDPPKYAGFWVEDLPRPMQVPGGEAVSIQGAAFRRFTLFQKLLYPTKAGELTLPASSLKIGVHTGAGSGDRGHDAVLERATKPLVMTVDPTPDVPGFQGAVGRFVIRATVDKASVAIGEALILRFEVEGNGNLKWIERGPEVKVPGTKVYSPRMTSNLLMTPSGIAGSRAWDFTVVPETSGTLEIPALSFSFFDVEKRHIVRLQTEVVRIHVGGPSAAGTPAHGTSEGVRPGNSLPLWPELNLPLWAAPLTPSASLAGILAIVVAVGAVLWWYRSRRKERPARSGRPDDVERALHDLERAKRGCASKEASVAIIERTLHDLFGPLEENDVPRECDRTLRDVLQEVDLIRYGPQLGDYSDHIRSVASRAAEAVRKWA